MRFELGEPRSKLPPPVWSPSAGATGPVYAPTMAAEQLAPASITFGSRPRLEAFDRAMPLAFLAAGSERFDLAFAGVAMPTPLSIAVAPGLPEQPQGEIRAVQAPLRARLIDVPQIAASRAFTTGFAEVRTTEAAPEASSASSSVSPQSVAVLGLGNDRVALANEAVEAAFAGEFDVSRAATDAIRRAIPMDGQGDSGIALPVEVETARAVPIPAPDPGLVSSRAEQVELVQKTQLDTRVNGVLTGAIDFEQRRHNRASIGICG